MIKIDYKFINKYCSSNVANQERIVEGAFGLYLRETGTKCS